jgi:superoxide dismutase
MPPQSVPPLSKTTFHQEGVPGVFSKQAFDTAWTKYQRSLVDNLNRLIGGLHPRHHLLRRCVY